MAGQGFEKAVEECYRSDGDEKRNGIRYYAPPEDYVEITVKAIVEMLRADTTSWQQERGRVAEFIESEFAS